MYNMISRINHKINNIRWGRLVALFVSVVMSFGAQAQSSRDSLVVDDTPRTRWMVRTNLIWWATLTPNVGVDYQVSPRWTLGATFGLNPWSRSGSTFSRHPRCVASISPSTVCACPACIPTIRAIPPTGV